MTDATPVPPPKRRRRAVWIALALTVPLVVLVAALAASPPSGTRSADSPLIGKLAPDIVARTIDGAEFRLSDLEGQWVLLNFFATWCVPCRTEHPQLIRWQERHQAAGDATVVGVVFDDSTSAVRRFRREEGGDWPMLDAPDGRVAVDYGVSGVPESYLISPNGFVVSKILGGILDGELEDLLQRARTGQR